MNTEDKGTFLSMRAALLAMQEKGITHISEEQARQIAGDHADGIIGRAHEIEAAERTTHTTVAEKAEAEDVFAVVGAAIQEKIMELGARLYEHDHVRYISEDSYVTRNEAHAELGFLENMASEIATLKAGETLDLSRTETDYGFDPEEAATDRMSGLEYVPAIDRDRDEHAGHIAIVEPQLAQPRAAGITIDPSFHTEAPRDYWEQEQEMLERLSGEYPEWHATETGINTAPVEGEQSDSQRPQSL